ncbi:hypothetical protein P2P98_16530 [Microbacterium sp. Kw_RZR3]|uniref:hypothetical protein n=1 Tax=Microbacterium sp. Kw_RZR3 TaxID=3032903 RepID=UPI0023D9E509|nr:hypothetical protein [Microbacterium sp. Kw_RZR3]MDF2047771.1 hypothetical protein [Microbacterium sp. Kw_RZR3]
MDTLRAHVAHWIDECFPDSLDDTGGRHVHDRHLDDAIVFLRKQTRRFEIDDGEPSPHNALLTVIDVTLAVG